MQYAWKVALVALACVPLIMGAGFARFKIVETKVRKTVTGSPSHIVLTCVLRLPPQDSKSDAIHEKVAQMACEAASAIQTVASLRREGVCVDRYSAALG